jgi:3-hydroxyacyl-CoA dehydrogenase
MSSKLKVGILSMGEMGVGIAKLLIAHGFPVATNCQGRRYVGVLDIITVLN